jgi:opacity protein-like surface antigen
MGVAAEVKYSGDMISGEISGGAWNAGKGHPAGEHGAWQIAAGVGFSLGDMAKISIAAGTGKYHDNVKWNEASILMSANLSDAVHGEVAFNYDAAKSHGHQTGVLAGLYYDPVSQLTIGLEGEYIRDTGAYAKYFNEYQKRTSIDLVTVFRF